MEKSHEEQLKALCLEWSGESPADVNRLPGSGSYRIYYRLIMRNGQTCIGVYNEDVAENDAFLSFTDHFLKAGLPVPEILKVGAGRQTYLLNDLGDITLYDLLSGKRTEDRFPEEVLEIYKKVLEWLPRFQIRASAGLDYSKCYPRAAFDRQSMHWDLNYFKYYFLKLAKIPFDEQKLEDDFTRLMDFLLTAGTDYFLYRDFQSRNIMISGGQLSFIDYQGGRKGPLQYDVASLLFDGKAAIPPAEREMLLSHYMQVLRNYLDYDPLEFRRLYNGYVLIRIFQAMGAYGFRGYYEKKTHFLQSIPYAVKNLEYLMKNNLIPEGLPALRAVIHHITGDANLRRFVKSEPLTAKPGLTVRITSFSFKKGLPDDTSGHGGGFVFDCRSLPNPGRYPEYSAVSGRDQEVIDYLVKQESMDAFLSHVYALVDQSVAEYIRRDFTSLSVSFGCTGGQHRSVYCSEKLAAHLKEKFEVDVVVTHREKEGWGR